MFEMAATPKKTDKAKMQNKIRDDQWKEKRQERGFKEKPKLMKKHNHLRGSEPLRPLTLLIVPFTSNLSQTVRP